jgi:hypothetical protein
MRLYYVGDVFKYHLHFLLAVSVCGSNGHLKPVKMREIAGVKNISKIFSKKVPFYPLFFSYM